ncbi:DUF2867 domain-containing protein [Embleya sp. MST-111070]|uniref:DUF2867 domain-containing protein n=1 Tax=Embleya sp. MST-111070 TaxID=3398231 RepID=UPI003F73B421
MGGARVRRIVVPDVAAPGAESSGAGLPGAGLPGAEYASAFELGTATARARTPEQWARAVFEGSPAVFRGMLLIGWTLVLGLRLGPRPSPTHVLGWSIATSDADSCTVTASSRLVTAHNTLLVRDDGVVWITRVRHERRIGRVVWGAIAPIHHLTVPWLLRRASRSTLRG